MKIEMGNVIELRNGQKFIYHHSGDGFSLDGKFLCHDVLRGYDEKNTSSEYDIMRIYSDYTLTTLLWERADVQGKLSDIERTILSAVYPTYKYIARDENGDLCLFKIKPEKYELMWKALGNYDILYCDFSAFNHLFKFVSWDDEKPHQILSLLY